MGKKEKGNKKDQQEEEQVVPLQEDVKKKKDKKKKGDDSEAEEEVKKPVEVDHKKKKGKKNKGDDESEEEEIKIKGKHKHHSEEEEEEEDPRHTQQQGVKSGGEGGLSKTQLKKLKREQKKGGGNVAANNNNNKAHKHREEEEQEQEQGEEEEEEEEEEEKLPSRVLSGFNDLLINEGGSEEDEDVNRHLKKAEKKKKKKETEKKKKVLEQHHIIPSSSELEESEIDEVPPQPQRELLPPILPSPVYEEEEEKKEEDKKEEEKKEKEKKEEEGEYVEKDIIVEEMNDLMSELKLTKKKKDKKKLKQELALVEEAITRSRPPDNKVFAVSATSVNQKDEVWKNSQDIIIPSFSITTFDKTLFKDAELRINANRRYGLVGPNGLGKSVLLRAIATKELPIPPSIDALYVEQEVVADDTPAIEVVLNADEKRSFLLKREKELMALIDEKEGNVSDETLEEWKATTDELRTSGADGAEAKALNLLLGLGFTEAMVRKPTKHLSGGWRMRVSIARGLFIKPTLLLLDEPTNHLDLEAVIFLESVLSKWETTLVTVSHDQDFLDSVCQEIIHLDSQKLFYYKGNYSVFEENHKIAKEGMKKEYEKLQKQIKQQKLNNNKLTNKEKEMLVKKNQREKRRGGGEKEEEELAIAAAGKNRNNQDLQAMQMDRPKDYVVQFSFPEPTELSPPIIQVRDVSFRYDNQPFLFTKLNFGLDMSSRICICGPNGSGKSTLIGLLTLSLTPTEGEVIVNRHLRVASYKQHFVDALPLSKTPVEYLHEKHSQPVQDIRGRLGRYGLSGVSHTVRMSSLSGGQKARVVFADMSYQNPHILILDEPSNNLDMESIRALGEAINDFAGGVILVSHDTRLITETDMVLWVIEKQRVFEQTGGIEEYRTEILEKLEKQEKEQKAILQEKQTKREKERKERLLLMENKLKKT